MGDGYLSQIKLYQAPVEAATDALDMKLVQGAKDEASLQPLMTQLEKAMDNLYRIQLHLRLRLTPARAMDPRRARTRARLSEECMGPLVSVILRSAG